MKTTIIISFLLLFAFNEVSAMKNYEGTEMQKCINCLCHARTGCYNRYNCANYSIRYDYWKTAKSPVIDENDDPNSENSFKKCMKNETCIYTTIEQYADAIGHMDCNCDGQFDCKDRLAIHLFGANCTNPHYGAASAHRFNSCSKDLNVKTMVEDEGYDGCEPEMFDDV